MTPERYKQVDELFQAALERPSQERAVFLDQVCSADPDLRREIEVLLSSDRQADCLIESPALELAPELLEDQKSISVVGRSIGPYQVSAHLGSGGMGEVFLAKDDRLGRNVALKLLPEYFTADEQRLRRFQQEARAASSLNHPNIITIFDIGAAEGKHFIATEYIAGETLRQQMAKARIGLIHALDIAIQVTQALAAAHDAGIVHRDIKPENIMVRPDGYVKVLDFGLAKLTERRTEGRSDATTITAFSTDPGTVMGTPSYMSPEQARGRDVDARTDIWSLGVVLYEMLAGRVPFEGETTNDAIAAILQKQPAPFAAYAPEAPNEAQSIINKALNKDKDERYQTIREMLSELKDLKQDLNVQARLEQTNSTELRADRIAEEDEVAVIGTAKKAAITTGAVEPTRTTSSAEHFISEIKRNELGAVIVLSLFAGLVGVATFGFYKMLGKDKPVAPSPSLSITRLTTNAKAKDAAISPDGKYVVYVMDEGGQQSCWVKQVVTGGTVQIMPPFNGVHSGLTFSKDGDYIYYVRQDNNAFGSLYQIPALGGASKKLIERVNGGVTLSPDGKQLAFLRSYYPNLGEELLIVAKVDGSGERVLASRKRPATFPWWEGQAPAWSPNGKTIACITGGDDSVLTNVIEVGLNDGTERRITQKGWYEIKRVEWLSDGSGLIITGADQEATFHAQQIWRISYPDGEAHRITADLSNYTSLSLTADSNSLVAAQLIGIANIWVAPDGEASRATQITSAGNHYDVPGNLWTPDGKIVYYSRASGSEDLWIMDRDGSNQKQLTVDAGSNYNPSVSADGRYIVFVSDRTGSENIWRVDIDGGNPKQLSSGGRETTPSCSPDGRWVLYTSTVSGKPAVWKVGIDGGDAVQLITHASKQPVTSPDGKFIACHYRDDPNLPWRMAIIPIEGESPLRVFDMPINTFSHYRWALDGRSLAYIDTRGGVSNIWSLPVDAGPPKQLTDFKNDRIFFFDWSRDGKYLVLGRGTAVSDVVLISNFR